ncbi:MAG: TonB-dependent receptor [Saprospiraceae bacterium]
MKRNFNQFQFLLILGFLLVSSAMIAQTTIRGTVTDDTGEALIGANVLVKGSTSDGDITDENGNYTITTSETFPLTLVFSYTGFTAQEIEVTSNAPVNVTLVEGILSDEIVISASRRAEKVQDAPASISVLSARKLQSTANSTDATRNLVNVAGVQIQQQSANRINISMRGSAGLFGTGVFPILDYRSLIGPGIGTFQSDQAGISNIDLQRIEVVRGAGSALYGPGVTQGVVHFITKNPIDFPGTTVEVMGGELNTFGIGARHATRVSDKFGFKINAQYRRGNEFTLDPNDPSDSTQIALFKTSIVNPALTSEGFVDINGTPTEILNIDDLDPDGDGNPMTDEWHNAAINATLEFRPKDNLSIITSGGFTNASSVFYNEQGEGLAQATEYWGQARMQYGGLFAQFFAVANDGGSDENPTFLYQTGNNTSIARTQLEGQLQYNWDMDFLKSNWTAGFDYRYAGQDTKSFVYGRNEDDDSYSVAGAYVQGKMALHDKVDMVIAARADKFNFIDDVAFAPRLALVYKAAPAHTFRGSFNRTASTVSNLQLNIDFPLNSAAWLYGNKNEQTFDKNLPLGWLFGGGAIPEGLNQLPLGIAYGGVVGQIAPLLSAGFAGNPATAPIAPIIDGVLATINPATLGLYSVPLGEGYNVFDGTPLGKINAPLTELSTSDAYELGYKGLIKNKLGVSIDIYAVTEKNNSQFTAISPSYRIEDVSMIGTELGAAIGAQIEAPMIAALMANAGMDQATAEATYAAIAPTIIGAYIAGGNGFAGAIGAASAHAASPTDQIPANGSNYIAAGYRTFDERTYVGYDIGLEYYFNNDVSAFFNYSGVNKNEFEQSVVGNEGAGKLPTYLNIPLNKFRLGATYAPEMGLRGSISFQYDQPYVASAGQFSTDDLSTPDVVEKTEARNLVDASVGYKFDFGLSIDASASNLLNTEYRYLPNMPKIGRRALVKLTYEFGVKND